VVLLGSYKIKGAGKKIERSGEMGERKRKLREALEALDICCLKAHEPSDRRQPLKTTSR